MTRFHIDSFTGTLGELPMRHRNTISALRALSKDPRVSTFERGTWWLENLLRDLKAQGLIVEDHAEPYPWCKFDLTDAGRAMLAAQPEKT